MPAIYKIDVDKLRATIPLEENTDDTAQVSIVPASQLHEVIKTQHELRKERFESKAQSYEFVIQQQVGRYNATVYKTSTGQREHKWTHLFEQEIPDLEVKYPNLAAFFAINNELYAISSGMGYTLFEQFIDTSFALDVARHIMKPLLTATTERDIAGAVYGRDQQFRSSQLVISSQNLGTVWQAIKGEVTDEFKARTDFTAIYTVGRAKITVNAGTAFTIHKSLDIRKLADLLDLLDKVLDEDLSPEQQEAFAFLDSLTLVKPRKDPAKIDSIKVSMGEQLLEDLVANNSIDFDFSHKNFTAYQSAMAYSLTNDDELELWDQPPSATEVLNTMKDNGLINATDGATLITELSNTHFTAEHHDPNQPNTKGSVLDHLHGEILHGSTRYFVIDGKYYNAKTNFIERVNDDFEKLLNSSKFAVEDGLTLEHFTNAYADEGAYNDSYRHKDNWIEGDRAFLDYVEIADLIHWQDDKLYIIHNKLGFNVSVRDVCSQILHSMAILNRVRTTSNREAIGKYYDKIIAKHYRGTAATISRDDFIDKLILTDSSDITFVIGYAQQNQVTVSSRSNIAKFEMVKLCENDSRAYDFRLKVVHIPMD